MVPARVAVPGRGILPPDEPVLRADDLGVLHGDGLFETMHVRDGRPWLRDRHLARLIRGAALIDLPLPEPAKLVTLLDRICAGWPTDTPGALRLVCTRGPETGQATTVFATLAEVPAEVQRTYEITVATLPLPVTAEGRARLAWLPIGLKSTSYALNSAARRWAANQGVDDVLWVSTDGYALEGPTANLVWLTGTTLHTVPASRTGVLPGVTASWLLEQAERLGLTAREQMVTPGQLRGATGVWFSSSLRGLVEVRTLDGIALRPSTWTPHLRTLLGFPTPTSRS